MSKNEPTQNHISDKYGILRTIYLTPDLDRKLRNIASQRKTSKNTVINYLLAEGVDRIAKKLSKRK